MARLEKDRICIRTGSYFRTLAEIKYSNDNTDTHIGVIFATVKESFYGSAYYGNSYSINKRDFRLATWREKLAYKEGIYHTNDIYKKTVFKNTICIRTKGKFSHAYFPNIEPGRDIGRIFKTTRTKTDGRFAYAGNWNSTSSAQARIATPEEVEAFEAGITHIFDIKVKTNNNNLKQDQNDKKEDYKEITAIATRQPENRSTGCSISSISRCTFIESRFAGDTTTARYQRTRISGIKISGSIISK